ncbi:MAG: efflux RND transporter permease subunit [Planctomycetota bacterium]|nr:efflux RND transporter permease subunit [Planctomycetota bacterium]
MIPRIIEFSVRNRWLVLLLTAVVAGWGVHSLFRTPIDAIPDLSENQVIVFTDWMGRSPQEIDDQITYPLSVNLQGLAGVKVVRSASEFNFSMITVIFDDKTDFYFARTRVLEKLSAAATYLPAGVVPYMAPDATALGQIFWYTVEGDGQSLDELRATQDWFVRYQLYVPGVAEVASVGGFVREYQVDVDPARLRAYGIPLGAVVGAVARSNSAVGGKVINEAKAEYLIRGLGWLRSVKEIESIVVGERDGVPILVRHVAAVQLGPEFRRSLLEKDGHEAVGGVVMMRQGENPLAVTRAIQQRIEQLQPGLPKGVRIVPFYDRTGLIKGAIHTLTGTLTEELVIASVAVVLILGHLGSALVICVTLPLAVLIAFILMHHLGVPSNIMSLSGIAISIGILVDASVVMVDNATHELTREFGTQRVRGDTTEAVVRACRLVGRPIFFAIVIMLLSFLPVFALGGQEGRMFHPLAYTKSFAMVGVALLAITFVPAMIPIFIRGKLKREEDNWIVRSFIEIYRPVLTWLMSRPAAGVWFMGALLVIGAGFLGSTTLFLCVMTISLFFGCVFFRRLWSQGLALALLMAVALGAWHLPKLGREFMPPLDEGSILDMPVTIPRVSLAQAGDDLRVRDAVMAGFPEVDQVVGKAGRADTPTDPSGPDMIETIVTLQDKAWWPKRKIQLDDAQDEARRLVEAMRQRGSLGADRSADALAAMAETAAMEAMGRFDRTMRDLARARLTEFRPILARRLVAETTADFLAGLRTRQLLEKEPDPTALDALLTRLTAEHGEHLVKVPTQAEMNGLLADLASGLTEMGAAKRGADLLAPPASMVDGLRDTFATAVGGERQTLAGAAFDQWNDRRGRAMVERVKEINRELEGRAGGEMVGALMQSILRLAKDANRASATMSAATMPSTRDGDEVAVDVPLDAGLTALRDEQAKAFIARVFLWHKTKGDLVKEMDSELQMPGWGNIWTQPIINRVDMLATGVRTMIGVKVFGPRQADKPVTVPGAGAVPGAAEEKGIQTISNEIAAVLRTVPGAADVFADQIVGRSYIEIEIDRAKAARYGVNVADVQEAIEVAMGGKAVTTTVEGRQRFPVRVRYARDFRQTREALGQTLVAGQRGAGEAAPAPGPAPGNSGGEMAGSSGSAAMPAGAAIQIPISQVAEIRVVEGPSVIKSENGMLRSYVQLNVRDRDIVGFVEEAQRAVASRVALPQGFHLEWSGQFEHQVRARKTLQLIFPVVILLIFVILLMTFNDPRDALLILLSVPGALVGGVIFQSLFGFNFSVAVWVGYIACFGMATQTGIVMLVYLHDAIRTAGGLEKIGSEAELRATIIRGAVHRLRPKLMTEGVAIVGLMPMLWAHGVGAEVMRPMAAPVLGGLLVADEVIDLLLPVIFNWYQARSWRKLHASRA